MSTELITGKTYHLRFHDNEADNEEYIEQLSSLSGEYKLIGEGIIRWGADNSEKYEYSLFKRSTENNVIEVSKQDKTHMSLVFYNGSKLTTGGYSDYLDHGDIDFPEFSGSNDIVVDVDIHEVSTTPSV